MSGSEPASKRPRLNASAPEAALAPVAPTDSPSPTADAPDAAYLLLLAGSRVLTAVGGQGQPLPVVRVQRSNWRPMPLSPFGMHLQRNALAPQPQSITRAVR